MYKTKQIETQVNYKEAIFYADIELTAKVVDASFSHGFGIESCTELELIQADLMTVYNEEGEVITNIDTINKIESKIYLSDFENEEFED